MFSSICVGRLLQTTVNFIHFAASLEWIPLKCVETPQRQCIATQKFLIPLTNTTTFSLAPPHIYASARRKVMTGGQLTWENIIWKIFANIFHKSFFNFPKTLETFEKSPNLQFKNFHSDPQSKLTRNRGEAKHRSLSNFPLKSTHAFGDVFLFAVHS